jgi:hypothetical protein
MPSANPSRQPRYPFRRRLLWTTYMLNLASLAAVRLLQVVAVAAVGGTCWGNLGTGSCEEIGFCLCMAQVSELLMESGLAGEMRLCVG